MKYLAEDYLNLHGYSAQPYPFEVPSDLDTSGYSRHQCKLLLRDAQADWIAQWLPLLNKMEEDGLIKIEVDPTRFYVVDNDGNDGNDGNDE